MIPSSLRKRIAGAAAGGVLLITSTVVAILEGNQPQPYLDQGGVPTVCVGHTGDVDMSRTYSETECKDLLQQDLSSAFAVLDSAVTVPLPDLTRVALASFIFNVGGQAFLNSTLLRRINRGEGATACAELKRWVYVGHQRVKGLENRREVEYELCVSGFQAANDNVPIPLERPRRDAA